MWYEKMRRKIYTSPTKMKRATTEYRIKGTVTYIFRNQKDQKPVLVIRVLVPYGRVLISYYYSPLFNHCFNLLTAGFCHCCGYTSFTCNDTYCYLDAEGGDLMFLHFSNLSIPSLNFTRRKYCTYPVHLIRFQSRLSPFH